MQAESQRSVTVHHLLQLHKGIALLQNFKATVIVGRPTICRIQQASWKVKLRLVEFQSVNKLPATSAGNGSMTVHPSLQLWVGIGV